MKRIDSANKSVDLFGAGKHGFRDGNKALGINPTEFNADWCNHVQEELANLVEGAGAALNPADRTQVLTAIQAIIQSVINARDYKESVRVASTAPINLAAPGANIDGVAMVAGNRFLEKDHATLASRGIYIWNGAAVPATRALDADVGTELNGGAIVPVEEGTDNADTYWQLTNNGTVTIGVTGLTFANFGLTPDASDTVKGKIEISTDAEAQAFASALLAITPSTLKGAFQGSNQSLSGNGYQKLPGGLILQWGTTGAVGSGVNLAVTLPIAYPNGHLITTVCFANFSSDIAVNTNAIGQVRAQTLSNFTVRNLDGASNQFQYHSIGY